MIEEFYRKNYSKQVKKIGYIINNHDAAQDVVQEAYRRATKYVNSYRKGRGEFSTWFNSILYNSMRDWERQDRDKGIVKKPITEDIPEEVPYVHSEEYRGLIKYEVDRLSGDERVKTVLYLWYVLGYSAREISQVVNNMTITNVTTLATRFRKLMQEKHNVAI